VTPDDGLNIPSFLRVTPEEAARRRQWWKDNPPRPMPVLMAEQRPPWRTEEDHAVFREELARAQAREEADRERKKAEGLARLAEHKERRRAEEKETEAIRAQVRQNTTRSPSKRSRRK
jgi:hypothetical protein